MSSKGFRILAIGLVVLLAGAGLFLGFNSAPQTVEAQDQATTTVQLPRTITVVGEGTVAVEPDVAEVQIGVDMTGDTADEARAEVAKTMDAIMAALTTLKIPKKDIQTSGFSIFVERPTTPDGLPSDQVIYHVSNNVTVTIRNLAKAGDVLEAAIEAGANNIYGVNFSVGNPDPLMVEARRKASEDARARAEELAALHGVEVGEVVSISEVIDGNAVPLESINARLAAGGGVGQIAPGELEMTARMQVVYAILASGATSSNGGVVLGRVTDPSGRPLAEATVTVPKGTAPVPEMTAITSSDGAYQWNLPAGTFTLEVYKDGYATTTVEVIVSAGETITQDFVLQPQ